MRLLICLVLTQLSFYCSAESVKVASAHWREFSEPGGKGVYLNLIKRSFDKHRIEFDVGSFARAKRLFKNNKADILVGVYKNDKALLGDVIFPKYHLDLEFPIVAIYNPRITKLRHSEDFTSLTVGWYEEYAYDRFVPQHGQSYRFTDIKKALALLESGKIDVVVDHIYNLDERQLKIFKTIELHGQLPIWLVFHNTEKGKRLKTHFEASFEQLYKSQALKRIYGVNYEYANFSSLFVEK
ncbi:hypothetical protein [Pseudoalteromonas sp.]|uniref:hypothetical protein n=1 Tax=Pseudoalteromonas sp. TaxID=53249 RepID=UPI00356ADCAC